MVRVDHLWRGTVNDVTDLKCCSITVFSVILQYISENNKHYFESLENIGHKIENLRIALWVKKLRKQAALEGKA